MLRPKIILQMSFAGLISQAGIRNGFNNSKVEPREKITILLVEQNAKLALSIGDYGLSWRQGA